jgi:hypothetical protein
MIEKSFIQVYNCSKCGFEHWDYREYYYHMKVAHYITPRINSKYRKSRSKHFMLIKK